MDDPSVLGRPEGIDDEHGERQEEADRHREHRRQGKQRILEAAMAETPEQGGRSQTYRLQAATLAFSNRATGAAKERLSGYELAGG